MDHRPNGLYGRIVDTGGLVVVDADVHYIFYTSFNPVVLSVGIQYGVTNPAVVTLTVFDAFGREVSRLIDGEQQLAGTYLALFDEPVTNGVYSYTIQIGDSLLSGSFFIRDDDITRLGQKPPLIKSDHGGQFFLSQSALGLGRTFSIHPSTDTILDSLSIVLYKEGYTTLIESFRLDTTKAVDRGFTLLSN